MEIRPVDRIVLTMLSEIYDALKIKGEVDTALLREAIFGGHAWALEWDMPGLTEVEEKPETVVKEVVDILDMHSALELAFNKLSAADQAKIKYPDQAKFEGFDGNNETEHLSVARMLIEKMGRWPEFKSRAFNSHMQTLDKKRRMLSAFGSITRAAGSRNLTVADIGAILDA